MGKEKTFEEHIKDGTSVGEEFNGNELDGDGFNEETTEE